MNDELNDDVVFEETAEGEGEALSKDKIKKLRDDLKVANTERMEYLTNWQRERADFVNYKKDEFARFARAGESVKERIVEDLLPVLDAYDMAFANKEAWEKVEKNWRMGVEYIHQQLLKVLSDNGVTPIAVNVGDTFDANIHEPVGNEETDDAQKDHTIAFVAQSGYKMGGTSASSGARKSIYGKINMGMEGSPQSDIESKKADIERRRQEELQSENILYHGTASKNNALGGTFDMNKTFASAGQVAGPGLYLTSGKEQAANYGDLAFENQKRKSLPRGAPAVLYFNRKDFHIVEGEIGKEIAQKASHKYPNLSIDEHTDVGDLFNSIVEEEYGQKFSASLMVPEMVEIMTELGIDGRKLFERDKIAHYVLYNFKKIKQNEVNQKYDRERATVDPQFKIIKDITSKF